MNSYLNKSTLGFYPDSYFYINQYKYKRFRDKIDNFNKDFEVFFDRNQKKMIKPKKKFNRFNINKLFRKLVFDSTNQVLKSYEQMNKKKRFLNDREIQRNRDKKIIFLKLIRAKNLNKTKDINNKNNNKNKVIYNYLRKPNSSKISNNSNDKKFFHLIKNKSIFNESSSINSRYKSQSQRNLYIKNKYNKEKYLNKSSMYSQNRNYNQSSISTIKYDENKKLINIYDENKNDFKDNISNNYFNDSNCKNDIDSMKKMLNLKKLKLRVNKFEHSDKYLANSDIIYRNLQTRNHFVNKKYLKNNILDRSTINNNFLNNSVRKRNVSSASSIFPISRNNIFSIRNNSISNRNISALIKSNSSMLFKRINEIQKKMRNKKSSLKKEKNKKSSYVRRIINYFNKKKITSKEIDNEMKKDFINYQKKIGHFIKVDGKYLFTSHFQIIFNERKKLFK